MANEFKVKHGLIVNGSGSTILDVQGSQGQLFSITDSLSGSLFSVGDISGIPILEVFSDDTVKIGSYNSEAIVVSGSHATVSGSFSGSFEGDGSGLTGIGTVDTSGTPANNQIAIFTDADTIEGDTNLTWDGSTFNINGTGSVDLLRVDDRLQGNGSGFQFFAYNEDTVKVKFANWYSSNDRQYGMGQLWFETWFAAIDNQASRDERRIGFYLEEPDAGSTDSGTPGQHPTNARFYVDINGAYLSGSFEASGDITGSDVQIDDWGSVSSSLASISASAASGGTIPTLQQVTDQGATTTNDIQISGSVNVSGSINVTGDQREINVLGDDGQLAIQLTDNVSGATDSGATKYYLNGNLYGYMSVSGGSPTDGLFIRSEANRAITFKTNGNNDRMVIQDTGNVGIGTTSPTQKLEVREGFVISSGSGVSDTGFILDRAGLDTYELRHMDGGFTVYNSTETRKEMTFNGAGRVGIGTTAPTRTLTVEGSISASGDLTVQAGDSTTSTYSVTSISGDLVLKAGSDDVVLRTGGSGTEFIYFQDSAFDNKVAIDAENGRLGIGTTSPETKLDVRGNAIIAETTPDARIGSTLEVYTSGSTAELSIHQDDSSASNAFSRLRFRNGGNDTYLKVPASGNGLIIDVENQTEALVIDVAGNTTIASNLTVQGSVTAQEFHTEFVSSSIIYQSGSTKFGDTSDDLHSFTGSIGIQSGSLRIETYQKGIEFFNGTDYTTNGIKLTSVQNMQFVGGGSFQFTPTGTMQLLAGKQFQFNNSANDNSIKVHNGASAGLARLDFEDSSSNVKMSISSSGNVGIGTSAPASLFVVDAADGVMVDTATALIRNRESTAGDNFGLYVQAGTNSGDISFRVADKDNNEYLRVRGDGNVGIGTTSPTVKLEVDGDVRLTTNGDELQFGNANVGAFRGESNRLVFGGYGGIDFNASNTSGISNQTLRMRINGTGQIGIGTAPSTGTHVYILHPSTKAGLDVFVSQSTAPTSPQLRVGRDAGQYYGVFTDDSVAYLVHRQDETGGSDHFVSNEIWSSATGTRAWRWRTADNTGGSTSTLMTLNQDGNLGIGTTSPNSKLDIQTTAQADVALKAGYGSNPNLIVGTNTGYTRLEIATGSYHHKFFTRTNSATSSERFRIEGGAATANAYFVNSNVGIGTSTPSEKLHVDGNVTASAFYGDGTNLTNVQRVPKVEYLSLTASIASDDIETLPNSLTYTTSSDGYEYLEVFLDGIRLNRTYEYSEVNTTQVRYLLNIPSGSMITYKSLTLV